MYNIPGYIYIMYTKYPLYIIILDNNRCIELIYI